MKRFHVHVAVPDLEASMRFYSALFGAEPTVRKPDYAKWMLDDPRLNFAISERAGGGGINHLGLQAENAEELEAIHANLKTAGTAIAAEKGAQCCYAKSDKYWVKDPTGIPWESFHSLDTIPVYGANSHEDGGAALAAGANQTAACGGTACCPEPIEAPAAKAACCHA
jgi:catechol 2,3-dioxygenase-like lactoylglutathione lyase family enzyme